MLSARVALVRGFLFLLVGGLLSAAAGELLTPSSFAPPKVAEASNEGELTMKRFVLPEGFTVEIIAAEPHLANPVAFDIDHQGRFWVAETFRLHAGVTDIRGKNTWLDEDLAARTVEDRISLTQYQFMMESADSKLLAEWVPQFVARLQQQPELADVASDLQEDGLQAYVEIDREAAGRLNVTVAAIDNALYNAYGQRLISTIFTQSNQYRVVLESASDAGRGLRSLDAIYVPVSGGATTTTTTASTGTTSSSVTQQVPLSAVARIIERSTPLVINHVGQFPATTISFNLAKGASLGEAVDAIRRVEQEMQMPRSIETRFQGAAAAFQGSLSSTLLLILAAVVTVYIVLGVLYESTIHPVTILSTLPTAAVGALLALLLTGHTLDIIGIIGIILLIGIVKKNAIMMIDFALDAERNQGMTPRDAIYQACLLRFRPILMTTMAAMLGAFPLMLATGMGAELRQPLGIAMVGGLLVSQVLTLFTTPVIYLAFDRLAARLRERFGNTEVRESA